MCALIAPETVSSNKTQKGTHVLIAMTIKRTNTLQLTEKFS